MFAPGTTIDRYRIEAPLGGGGMGLVFRGYDLKLKRPVAIKVVRPELARGEHGRPSSAALRLVREARAAAALQHPNVAALYDVGETDGLPYLVMELIEGESLASLVGDRRIRVVDRILWAIGIARALDAAHRVGLVHRDVKPENVMIARDGTVKVLDFGIVKNVAAPVSEESTLVTKTGVMVGTPAYISPEQVLRQAVDGRSDQFAWGILTYELLSSGIHPFSTNNPRNLAPAIAVLNISPTPVGELVAGLGVQVAGAVMRALARDPQRRFPTLGEAADVLERSLGEAAERTVPPPRLAPPPRPAPPQMPLDDFDDAATTFARGPIRDPRALTSPAAAERGRTEVAAASRPPAPPTSPGRASYGPMIALIAALVVVGLAVGAVLAVLAR